MVGERQPTVWTVGAKAAVVRAISNERLLKETLPQTSSRNAIHATWNEAAVHGKDVDS